MFVWLAFGWSCGNAYAHPSNGVIDMRLFLNLASNQSPSQRLTSEERGPRHLKIHPVDEGFGGRVRAKPRQFEGTSVCDIARTVTARQLTNR